MGDAMHMARLARKAEEAARRVMTSVVSSGASIFSMPSPVAADPKVKAA